MKNTIILFVLFPFYLSAQDNIDSIHVYVKDFYSTTRYGFWEDDVIGNRSPYKVNEKDLVKINNYLLDEFKLESQEYLNESMDLRMACVLFYPNKIDTIGFSYINYMSFNNQMIKPRNDDLLKLFLPSVNDPFLRKRIKQSIRSNKVNS